MIFTHRSVNARSFNLGEISMENSDSVKYLGIILDPCLSFKLHLDKVKKCGINTINQLNRISRCSFGLGLQQSRNLIISVLRSIILYGSSIWASKRNEAAVKNVINKINNQANRVILGVFRTTPCLFLDRDSPLIPFFDVLKRKNHLYFFKKLTASNNHPIKQLISQEIDTQPSSHRSSIHNVLDGQLFQDYDLRSFETI
jgi:hypothetical protein